MRKEYGILRRMAGLLLIVLAVVFVMPSGVYASEKAQGRTIRVGWHDAPFFITDKDGRCSGYAYEYLSKLAAYTGWEYEYVDASVPFVFLQLCHCTLELTHLCNVGE